MLVACASACGLWCARDGFRGLRLVDGTRTGAGGGEPDLTLRLLADHGRDQAPDRGDEAGRVEEDNVLGGGGWLELGLRLGLGLGFGLGFGLTVVVLAHGGPRPDHLEEGARDLPQKSCTKYQVVVVVVVVVVVLVVNCSSSSSSSGSSSGSSGQTCRKEEPRKSHTSCSPTTCSGLGLGLGLQLGLGLGVQPGHRAALLAEPLQLERDVLVGVDPVLHELTHGASTGSADCVPQVGGSQVRRVGVRVRVRVRRSITSSCVSSPLFLAATRLRESHRPIWNT
eukprot:scaffold57688_cov59-Phaeocystis_antarctica.AAC.5